MKYVAVTLRDETEWVETVTAGWNVLAGCDPVRIVESAHRTPPNESQPPVYGDANAAKRIVHCLAGNDMEQHGGSGSWNA